MEKSKDTFMEVRSKSLFNIQEDFLNIELMLLESDGEITEDVEKLLVINKNELTEKSNGYITVIGKIENEVNYIDAEIKRLTAQKKVRKNAIDRMKSSILTAMNIYEIDKIDLPLHKISIRNSQSLEITLPIDELPSRLQKIKIETINKNEIKKMLKSGDILKGVKLIDNQTLNIK